MGPARFQQVIPVLPVRNVAAALLYYINRLQFTLSFQDAEQEPRYAVIQRGAVRLHLQWHDPVDFRENVDTVMLRFMIDHVDALFDEYKERDLFHDGTALRNTAWGTREFAFYDLDGNGLTFYSALS